MNRSWFDRCHSPAVFLLVIAAPFVLLGCAPDLVVKNQSATWNATIKSAQAEIANVGRRPAGEFLVYFNADEDPVSMNHRPQVSRQVSGLASGASILLVADFALLAHPDNANLGNVKQITFDADPKNMVRERNEGNNQAVIVLP